MKKFCSWVLLVFILLMMGLSIVMMGMMGYRNDYQRFERPPGAYQRAIHWNV